MKNGRFRQPVGTPDYGGVATNYVVRAQNMSSVVIWGPGAAAGTVSVLVVCRPLSAPPLGLVENGF